MLSPISRLHLDRLSVSFDVPSISATSSRAGYVTTGAGWKAANMGWPAHSRTPTVRTRSLSSPAVRFDPSCASLG